ncbi:MAG: hypothetical protein N4A61_04180, partial [Pelagimonas sp.]|nr:hypothetical protein [Pelagimonas sp.]
IAAVPPLPSPGGRISGERRASRILARNPAPNFRHQDREGITTEGIQIMASNGMREEITITAQMIYDCPAEASLQEQGRAIHDDLVRLLDADSTTGVACSGVSIQHLSPEALTYGNAQARQLAERQSDRIIEALSSLYDTDAASDLLIYALCDLRHLADQSNLLFDRHDKNAFQYYRAEKDADDKESMR